MGYTKVMSFELNGVQIKTTVSDEVKVIDEHISSFLQPTDNHRTKVIGFDIERRLPFKDEPATFQLCDGNSCLIFHSHPGYSIPVSFSNFLCQPNYTFVGCGIKNSFDYLEKRRGIVCKNAVELGTLAATLMDEPYLSFCGVDELAFVVNKLDLRKYRPLNLDFDWDSYPLSEELAKLATVNVYCYHKIGSALLERYSRDKTQKDSNGSEATDKKYSRDFLLKFAEQCSVLPEGFETMADIAEALMPSYIGSHVMVRDSYPSPAQGGNAGVLSNPRPQGTVCLPSKVKCTSKGKKKRKEFLRKADASGSTLDLYKAYKGPELKKETVVSSETCRNLKQLPADAAQLAAVAKELCGQTKAELEDWEHAADMSTPKLEVSDKTQPDSNRSEVTDKKYSRDFLLKFAEQCSVLPEGFEIMEDIADALMGSNTGRNTDRSGGMSRMDRRGSGVIEYDKWNKVPGAFHSGMRLDGIGGNPGFRPGQGDNFGVLRNQHPQAAILYGGGILSGPMQSMVPQGGMQRNSPDSERWQRAANFQQSCLIPSPSQSPLQTMHKAEKKYEVGKVTDEEQAKQRQLKGILNKLTPQNFEKLFEQVKAVNIDNVVTLTGVISQIFEKAFMEPTFSEMYANLCFHLAAAVPDLSQDNEKITFKRLLLNVCQEEFERCERKQEEANKADEGEVKHSDEEREAKRSKARRRLLGNIRLIGELYKKKMLTERIMQECIKKLLGQCQNPNEEDIEALCKLMSTIGEMIDHPKAKEHMDVYFERIKLLSNNMDLSSRVRFMLKDTIALRKNRWQQSRKVEGMHRDASQAGRLGRGMRISTPRRTPLDFGSRGSSMFSPPNAQMGGLPNQFRGYGSQDVRGYERQSFDDKLRFAIACLPPRRPPSTGTY